MILFFYIVKLSLSLSLFQDVQTDNIAETGKFTFFPLGRDRSATVSRRPYMPFVLLREGHHGRQDSPLYYLVVDERRSRKELQSFSENAGSFLHLA